MSQAALLTESDGQWRLQGDLSFATCAELYESARVAMTARLPTSVDLAAVERVDSSGVALMLDWLRAARAASQPLAFHNVPEHMQKIAELCGVGHLFGH